MQISPYAKSFRASALIEFALLMPVFCFILFGILEFGIVLSDKNIVSNASRQGARYGVVQQNSAYPTSAQISSYITTNYTTGLVSFSTTAPSPTITVTSSANPPVVGATLTVQVSYPYTWLILNKLIGLSNPFTITATTIMIYE